MNKQKLIEKYNTPETLLVLTSYPVKDGEGAKLNAVACYAENLLTRYTNRPIVILAETTGSETFYEEGNKLVIHCWKPGSPSMYYTLALAVHQLNNVHDVLVQFEFNMLGSVILTTMLPGFLAYLKLLGKRITVVQHQVVENLADLGGHLNVREGSLKNALLTNGLRGFYRLLGSMTDAIIVHENVLKNRLAHYVHAKKIHVVSHGLSLSKPRPALRKAVRAKLGIKDNEYVLLLFGYIAWYKGVDWLIKTVGELALKHPEMHLKLIIAGGPSATLKSKAHYLRFLQKVEKLVSTYSNSTISVGYVPDEEVQGYFEATDLVVLPYRTMMSASGPLSFALRYNKPFVMSRALKDACSNPDMAESLKQAGIESSNLLFSLTNKSFAKIIQTVQSSRITELKKVSGLLRQKRVWKTIVANYEDVITRTSTSGASTSLIRLVIRPLSALGLV